MVSLVSLWLPIVVTAAGVFVASSVIWMALPFHKTDWKKLPDQEAVQNIVRGQKLGGGMYMFPWCAHGDMKKPEAQAAMDKGPWGSLLLLGTKPSMGRMLGLWFLHLLIVSVVVGYVLTLSMGGVADADRFKHVFRVGATAALCCFAGGAMPGAIWEGKTSSFAAKQVFDAVIYALIAGAVFGWLWPHS